VLSSEFLVLAFRRRGILVHASTKAVSMEKSDGGISLKIQPKDGEPAVQKASFPYRGAGKSVAHEKTDKSCSRKRASFCPRTSRP